LKTAIAFPAMPKMIDFSVIAIFGPFRKRQFLATPEAPHCAIRGGLYSLQGHGICVVVEALRVSKQGNDGINCYKSI
jgi:hypothetical protein